MSARSAKKILLTLILLVIRQRVPDAAAVLVRSTRADATPNDHFFAGPNCPVVVATLRSARDAHCHPRVLSRIVNAAAVENGTSVVTTPYDHFRSGPNGGVNAAILEREIRDRGPGVR